MNRILPALQIGWSLQYLQYNLNHILGVIKCILLNVLGLMQAPTLYNDLQKLIAIYWFESHPKEDISWQSILTPMYLQWLLYWQSDWKMLWFGRRQLLTKCSRIIQLLLNGNCVKSYFSSKEKKTPQQSVQSNIKKSYWSAQTVLIFIWTHDCENVKKYPVLEHVWSMDLMWNPVTFTHDVLYD